MLFGFWGFAPIVSGEPRKNENIDTYTITLARWNRIATQKLCAKNDVFCFRHWALTALIVDTTVPVPS